MSELTVLQSLRMKGRATSALVAQVTGLSPTEVDRILTIAVATDLVVSRGTALRLTASGRKRLDDLLAAERRGVDQAALGKLYPAFITINAKLKEAIAAWQLCDGMPNNHADVDYDAAAIARLMALDTEAALALRSIAATVPRLARYVVRLELARSRIAIGDYSYVAGPTVDSYHQIWFELHDELITLLGLSRQAEDAADR